MRTRFTAIHARQPVTPAPDLYALITLGGMEFWGGNPTFSDDGPLVVFSHLEGWFDSVESSGETTPRVLADGGWENRAFLRPRYITVKGTVWAPDYPLVGATLDRILEAIPVRESTPFVVYYNGGPSYVMARQAGKPIFEWDGKSYATFDIHLVAADHRRFAGTGPDSGWQEFGPTHLPRSTGGLTYPLRFPHVYTGSQTSGRIAVSVGGTAPPLVQVEWTGPVDRPTIIDQDGRRLTANLTLDVGEHMTVDLSTRQAHLEGVSRRGLMMGDWPRPQRHMVLRFDAASYNPDALMLVRAKETYR